MGLAFVKFFCGARLFQDRLVLFSLCPPGRYSPISHDKVHTGGRRCCQWYWEGCYWYECIRMLPVIGCSENSMLLASSTGLLLKTTGLKVTAIKIDPYMNIDAGTMRPTEHGETYQTIADGITRLCACLRPR